VLLLLYYYFHYYSCRLRDCKALLVLKAAQTFTFPLHACEEYVHCSSIVLRFNTLYCYYIGLKNETIMVALSPSELFAFALQVRVDLNVLVA